MTLWAGGWHGAWVGDWQGESARDGFANMGLRAFGASTVTLGLVAGSGPAYADMSVVINGSGSFFATLADRGQVSVPGGNRPFVDRDAGRPLRAERDVSARDEADAALRPDDEGSTRYLAGSAREESKEGKRSSGAQRRPVDGSSIRRKA